MYLYIFRNISVLCKQLLMTKTIRELFLASLPLSPVNPNLTLIFNSNSTREQENASLPTLECRAVKDKKL